MTTPIEGTALCRLLSRQGLDCIRTRAQRRSFQKGQYLYREGESAQYLWVISRGEVRTLRGSSRGKVMTLERLGPGDLFGMGALAPGGHYTETAQGVVTGEVWRVPCRVVTALLLDDPEIARALLSIVADRLEGAHDRLCSFAYDTVPSRIARAVLESSDGGRIVTSRRLLAESAGTTVETAIRVLRRFERAGWIEGGFGWIRVLDRESLARVAQGESPDN